jgi:hypothetical protein
LFASTLQAWCDFTFCFWLSPPTPQIQPSQE